MKMFQGKKVTIIRIDPQHGSVSHYEPIECFEGVEEGCPMNLPSGGVTKEVTAVFPTVGNPFVLYIETEAKTTYLVVENP